MEFQEWTQSRIWQMHRSKNSKITLLLVSIGENLPEAWFLTGMVVLVIPLPENLVRDCVNRPASLPWLFENDDILRWNGPPFYKGNFCIESVRKQRQKVKGVLCSHKSTIRRSITCWLHAFVISVASVLLNIYLTSISEHHKQQYCETETWSSFFYFTWW